MNNEIRKVWSGILQTIHNLLAPGKTSLKSIGNFPADAGSLGLANPEVGIPFGTRRLVTYDSISFATTARAESYLASSENDAARESLASSIVFSPL